MRFFAGYLISKIKRPKYLQHQIFKSQNWSFKKTTIKSSLSDLNKKKEGTQSRIQKSIKPFRAFCKSSLSHQLFCKKLHFRCLIWSWMCLRHSLSKHLTRKKNKIWLGDYFFDRLNFSVQLITLTVLFNQ